MSYAINDRHIADILKEKKEYVIFCTIILLQIIMYDKFVDFDNNLKSYHKTDF